MKNATFGLALRLCGLMLALPLFLASPAQAEIMGMQPRLKLGIGARPAVMFLTVHNKGAATQLTGAESAAFERIELHTHEMNGGMMRMVKRDNLPVPANGMLALKPGGHHLMLFGLKTGQAEPVTVTLIFADGRTLDVTAKPTKRAKPTADKMRHHGH
jgi:copper(I)-binding protein